MPIGILSSIGDTTISIVVPDASTVFDLHAALGSPTEPVLYSLTVLSGYLIGSTGTLLPSIDASTGMHADSVGYWTNEGRISAAGGWGGAGLPVTGTSGAGGGGGGAGDFVGVGGSGDPDGTDGDSGTATAGGNGGANFGLTIIGISGEPGGDAIWVNHQITIANGSGEIWGGGGGGAAGFGGFAPGAGGANGLPGVDAGTSSSKGGVAGNSVRLISGAPAPVFMSGGADPNLKGAVGA